MNNYHRRNKFERIKVIKLCDVNTEDSFLISGEHSENTLKNALMSYDFISLRTFREKETHCPHYPYISVEIAIPIIKKLLFEGYSTIIAKPVNPEDCLFAGAAMKNGNQLTIEIADGPGTVRRVTNNGKIDRRYSVKSYELTNDNMVNYCISQFNKIPLDNCIFEFSWYNKPVGYKQQNFILWEVTDDGTKKSTI